jgi:adenosylhomocysteinase
VELLDEGLRRIEWAYRRMPVIRAIRERFGSEKPLDGVRVTACLHVTTETANLVLALREGGAQVAVCASNPLSTQDDVVAALNHTGIPTFARRGVEADEYYRHINQALDIKPHYTMDDGADTVTVVHTTRRELLSDIRAGTEETTTGVIRLRAMAADGALEYPIIAVNDAMTKHFFDNRYGTGQSTIDGILRATNFLIAGSTFVVAGYGFCGRGIAERARGLGARVIVVEVDPVRALEAAMDGFWVTTLLQAAPLGDVFVTATGNLHVIRKEHFEVMKDGAIMANSGHFDVEIDKKALGEMARSRRVAREDCEEFVLGDGKRLYLLGEGRLVNLAAAEGHPAEVMDMSFANQALCLEWLTKAAGQALPKQVLSVPPHIDAGVADLKLRLMGVEVDHMTEEQQKYIKSWKAGT